MTTYQVHATRAPKGWNLTIEGVGTIPAQWLADADDDVRAYVRAVHHNPTEIVIMDLHVGEN